jgi:hypothetical protein
VGRVATGTAAASGPVSENIGSACVDARSGAINNSRTGIRRRIVAAVCYTAA